MTVFIPDPNRMKLSCLRGSAVPHSGPGHLLAPASHRKAPIRVECVFGLTPTDEDSHSATVVVLCFAIVCVCVCVCVCVHDALLTGILDCGLTRCYLRPVPALAAVCDSTWSLCVLRACARARACVRQNMNAAFCKRAGCVCVCLCVCVCVCASDLEVVVFASRPNGWHAPSQTH